MSFDIVFIGETNDGKTTIVASLMEDENAVISSTPGTTKEAHCHRFLDRSGKTILRAWDTPGFEETDDMHAWFVAHADAHGDDPVKAFIKSHATDSRWERDLHLLRPISDGALVVFVAASNRMPLQTDDKQLQIIRLAGANRIALINKKPGKDYSKEWNKLLKREIGIVRTYEPFSAGILQRLELLQKLADCCDENREQIEAAHDALKADWEDRLEDLARMMLGTLHKVARASAFCTSKEEAERKLGAKLENIEQNFRKDARKLFHHQKLQIEAEVFSAKLQSTETWRLLGLGMTRSNAMKYGAVVGASIGLVVDVSTAAWTLGIPTVTGAAVGAALAAVYIFTPFGKGKGSQNGYEAVVEVRGQMLNVLLDRMIIYARCILRVSHGNRLQQAIQAETVTPEGNRLSFVDRWGGNEQKSLAKLVGKMTKTSNMAKLEEGQTGDFDTIIRQIVTDLEVV